MKKLMISLSKAEISHCIAILWTLACILVYCGWTGGPVTDGIAEKMYSVEVMIITYYFAKHNSKPTQDGN